ncbi:hypothetical protein [Micromonospora sp. NBC_01796]|uniref:hypothetical protein n=1 Tax=Micromonospora sp. NBC_01796 TaxID=2975987 RepID=UPI002DDB02DF|nr:hypothetical protein [Micromonospora sp. NBC_01796]WSA85067.1 hypothetical protein OIE47_32690 [Micromonospora sp. NBC_01796]
MELHRDDRGSRKLALIAMGYAMVALLVGGLFALVGGRPGFISVLVWASGAFIFLAGMVLLLAPLRRFQIVLTESGLVVHAGGCDFEGSWDQVDAISIEAVVLPNGTLNQLVLWVPDRVAMRRRPRFPGSDRKGYVVVELGELVETPEQVIAALQRYAGPRFRSPARA